MNNPNRHFYVIFFVLLISLLISSCGLSTDPGAETTNYDDSTPASDPSFTSAEGAVSVFMGTSPNGTVLSSLQLFDDGTFLFIPNHYASTGPNCVTGKYVYNVIDVSLSIDSISDRGGREYDKGAISFSLTVKDESTLILHSGATTLTGFMFNPGGDYELKKAETP